jgi:hypothetical protein
MTNIPFSGIRGGRHLLRKPTVLDVDGELLSKFFRQATGIVAVKGTE